MSSIRVLVVEDEIIIAETIRLYLQERGHEFLNCAISYEEAVNFHITYEPDVVLLDVRLYGKKSGIDFAHYLLNCDKITPYIFLTSQFDKKIIQKALETEPAGYLTKPIQKETLWTTIELVHAKNLNKRDSEFTISINDGTNIHKIRENEIMYILVDHVYIKIFLANGDSVMTRQSLSQIYEELNSEKFIQCHRSFIINSQYVSTWNPTCVTINGKEIPISRSKKNEFMDRMSLMVQY